MVRLVRLLRAWPELLIMVKALVVATRSVICSLAVFMVIIYGFSVAMTTVTKDNDELRDEYYASVATTVSNIFLIGVLPDQADLMTDTATMGGVVQVTVLLMCMLLTTLTGMNMIVGAMVEVISTVAVIEKDRLDMTYVRDRMLLIWGEQQRLWDKECEDMMSKAEFFEFLRHEKVLAAMQGVGTDALAFLDIVDYLFKHDAAKIDFASFFEAVVSLRGSNACTVSDILRIRKLIQHDLQSAIVSTQGGGAAAGSSMANLGNSMKLIGATGITADPDTVANNAGHH